MKTVDIEDATLASCVRSAQSERVVVTRDGSPVALIVGLERLDEEQLWLGESEKFWTMIRDRRKETTMSRADLEQALDGGTSSDDRV